MKRFWKLIVITICFLTLTLSNAFAALDAATVWEVRTTGADTNGGGFNADNAAVGSDHTQQDAAEDSGTDLVSADGDVDGCVVTSATHNFVADDNGNVIQITEVGVGAFTLGFYEIVSTAANAATLDRACGADGALSDGDWAYGGALAHPQKASTGVVAGNTVNVEVGTYQQYGAENYVMDISVAGSTNLPITWDGYNASAQDDPSGADRPVFDGDKDDGDGKQVTNVLVTNDIDQNIFKNIIMKDANGDIVNAATDRNRYENCRFTNAASDAFEDDGSGFVLCEFDNNTGMIMNAGGRWMSLLFCYIHDNTNAKATDTGDDTFMVGSIVDSSGRVEIKAFSVIFGNTFYNSHGIGLYSDDNSPIANQTMQAAVSNNIFLSNTSYAYSRISGGQRPYLDYNDYYDNGESNALQNATKGANSINTDPDIPNAAAGDFTVNAGSPVLSTGGEPVAATGDYKWNMGADQDDNAAASGTNANGAVGIGF